MIYCILYFVGVVVCFCLLEQQYKEYEANHPEKQQSKKDCQYAHSMMIVVSLFSWLSIVALIAGSFCAYGNGDDKDEYIDDIEDSDSN